MPKLFHLQTNKKREVTIRKSDRSRQPPATQRTLCKDAKPTSNDARARLPCLKSRGFCSVFSGVEYGFSTTGYKSVVNCSIYMLPSDENQALTSFVLMVSVLLCHNHLRHWKILNAPAAVVPENLNHLATSGAANASHIDTRFTLANYCQQSFFLL